MNQTLQHTIMAAAAALMAGCATSSNPPLMFGDSTTYGLQLGNDTATAGGSVSLGYKAQSVAVVPVSVLDDAGTPHLLNGHGDKGLRDAMSVFASFKNTGATDSTAQTVRLGQVFSTGLAAQALTMGYLCREWSDERCGKTAVDNAVAAAEAANKLAASRPAAATERRADATAPVAPASNERPYQAPLLFLRTDVVGINIGGSVATEGLKFDLGYTNRNLALVPLVAEGSGQKLAGLYGRVKPLGAPAPVNPSDVLQDAYSVMGQFSASTETAKLSLGLERYFATGVAAYNLGESMRMVIAHAPAAPAASAATASAIARAGAR
jgi:hypothetical protein